MKKNPVSAVIGYFKTRGILLFLLLLQMVFLVYVFLTIFRADYSVKIEGQNLIPIADCISVQPDGSYGVSSASAGNTTADVNTETVNNLDILQTDAISIPSGAYDIKINYNSIYDLTNPDTQDSNDYTGYCRMSSDENPNGYTSTIITFPDGKTVTDSRIWVNLGSNIEDLKLTIHYNGIGKLEINSIEITEAGIWRITRFIGWLCFMILLDVVFVLLFGPEKFALTKDRKYKFITIAGIIIFSSIPMFGILLYSGDDLTYHLERIWAVSQGLKAGQFPVRIQSEMLNGYGYATSLFYGDLLLYIPAGLYLLSVPLYMCYQIYVIGVNIATCLVCYYCFKKITNDTRISITGAFIYTLSTYRILNIYMRGAVGEYSAMIFLPLIVLGFYQVLSSEKSKKIRFTEYLPIIIGLSGLILTHILTCEMAALFIVLICILHFRTLLRPRKIWALLKALILTLLLNAWFLWPFLNSMDMDINIFRSTVNKIQSSGLTISRLLSLFYYGFNSDTYEWVISVGGVLLVGIAIFIYSLVEYGEGSTKEQRLGYSSFGLALLAMGMTTIYFPWDSMESYSYIVGHYLSAVQFPWRYLTIATVLLSFVTVTALWNIKKSNPKIAKNLEILLCICAIVVTSFFYMTYVIKTTYLKEYSVNEIGTMVIMKSEYLPYGTNIDSLYVSKVTADEGVVVSDYSVSNGITTATVKNTDTVEETVTFPLLNYENYHALDINTGKELTIENGINNTIKVVVPISYQGTFQIKYIEPGSWKTSEIVSLMTFILLLLSGCSVLIFRKIRTGRGVKASKYDKKL